MLRSFENFDRDHSGYDTSTSLLAVVRSLSRIPGRKTVVFFSEGLPVSPALSARLDAVIEPRTAPTSPSTRSTPTACARRARASGAQGARRVRRGAPRRTIGTDRTEQPLSMAMERVEDTLQARFARRAGAAPGRHRRLLVEGSNNLVVGVPAHRRRQPVPLPAHLRAEQRRVGRPVPRHRVKVARPGVQVFARKGYRALRARPASDAAHSRPRRSPCSIARRCRTRFRSMPPGFSFPDPARPGLTPLLVHVGPRALRYDVDAGARFTPAGPRSSCASATATDARSRRSARSTLSGEAKDLEAAKTGRDPLLPRARSGARRLHDGVDRVRRPRAPRQRARRRR